MGLVAPEKVQKLRAALHAKAKGAPDYRFYTLYDKLYREDVLAYAYRVAKANGGAPGVDGESFEAIEAYGEERWLGELAQALRTKTYRPLAIRRVYIPKPKGGQRPLGIPCIRDRVVQTAAVVLLGSIFEADLPPEQYAYRPQHNALDAVQEVHRLLNRGYTEVVEADLEDYFGSIPHAELLRSVARRVSDWQMLHLIKAWLIAPVEEEDRGGKRQRRSAAKDRKRGVPQGAPISPLLSNLYMRRFVLGWRVMGYAEHFKARIVNYADDLVLLCRGQAEEALAAMRKLMQRLKLTVNEAKTRITPVPHASVEFLGYTLGRCYSTKTGRAYIGTRPSKKSIHRVCRAIKGETDPRSYSRPPSEQVVRLNRLLAGWANYFCLGPVSKAYRAVDHYASVRLRRWLCKKHQQPGQGTARYPDEYLYHTLGLLRLTERTHNFPWATT